MRTARIDLYKDNRGKWRWRYVSSNGRTLADSGQGYRDKANAVRGLELVTGGVYRDTKTYGPEFDRRDGNFPLEVRILP